MGTLVHTVPLVALLALVLSAERSYDQLNERSRTQRCVELKQPRWPGQSPCRAWVRIPGERKGR